MQWHKIAHPEARRYNLDPVGRLGDLMPMIIKYNFIDPSNPRS